MENEVSTDAAPVAREASRTDQALAQVRQALSNLQYGQVVITVQDGVAIQIERVERVRLSRGAK